MKPVLLGRATPLPIESLMGEGYEPPFGQVGPGKEAVMTSRLRSARIAAEAHRRARYHVQSLIKPGMSMTQIAEIVENATRTLIGVGYNKGIGFPTGLSLNECAAHDTPNPKDPEVLLKDDDVLKIDFGTHVDGYIMDSAFTVAFNPVYEPLLRASKEATWAGINLAGIDASLEEIGAAIEEVIRSYELEIGGHTYAIKPVANLNGHTILRYKIHGGKHVPIVKNSGVSERMEDGEFYAIETFASTGDGYVRDKSGCSHYMLNPVAQPAIKLEGSKKLYQAIKHHFHTLPFCPRYIEAYMKTTSPAYLKNLVNLDLVEEYPPLVDRKGSFVSQFEHTLYIGESSKEVLTAGDDY